MPKQHSESKIPRNILLGIALVNGLCAVFFGGLMMIFPVDTPFGMSGMLSWMGNFPFQEVFFQNLFWPGLALLLWNGVMNLAAAVAIWRQANAGVTLSLIAGVMLIAWCLIENIFMFNFPAVFYGAVGIVQVVLSVLVRRRQTVTG